MTNTTKLLAGFGLAMTLIVSSAQAAALAGVPMKEHHAAIMKECSACHGADAPKSRPDDKACIGCHGTMDKIPTKPNKYEKFPHASAHYGSTLECTTCHAEHKPSRALCNDCHVVEFPNLK